MIRVTVQFNTLAKKLRALHKRTTSIANNAIGRVTTDLASELVEMTSSWSASNRPRFKITPIAGGNKGRGFKISTDSEIYKWLDKGTKKHSIPKKPFTDGHTLVFEWTSTHEVGHYQPKTAIMLTQKTALANSGGGGYDGGVETIYPKQVDHPGTKARKWSEMLTKKYGHLAIAAVRKELNEELKR